MAKRICSLCSKYFGDTDFETPRGFTHGLCVDCNQATREAMLENKNRRMMFYFKWGKIDASVANINGEFLDKNCSEPCYRELVINSWSDIKRLHDDKLLF
jgi:hypothetical protein